MLADYLFYLPFISEDDHIDWLTQVVKELRQKKYGFRSVFLVDIAEEPVLNWKWLLFGWLWTRRQELVHLAKTHFIKVNILPLQRLALVAWLNEFYYFMFYRLYRSLQGKVGPSVLVSARFDQRFSIFIKVFKPNLVIADVSDYKSKKEIASLYQYADLAITTSLPLYKCMRKIVPTALVSSGYFTLKQLLRQRLNFKYDQSGIVFIGSIDWRMNFKLVLFLMKSLPKKIFRFYYSIDYDLPRHKCTPWEWHENQKARYGWNLIQRQPNFRGYMVNNQSELARIKVRGAVGIIPYTLDTTFNQYCHPVKFFNYLNYGLKVVSVPLKSIKKHESEQLSFAKNYQHFLNLLEKAMRELSFKQKRYWQQVAELQTTEKRAEDLNNIIRNH